MTVAGLTRLWLLLGRVLHCLAAGAIILTFGWSGVTDADTVERTGAALRACPYPDSRARTPVVAGISPPTDGMLVTERAGRLRYVAADGTLDPTPISAFRKPVGEAAGRAARRGAASPVLAEPPRLLRLCRQGHRRLRHRARPGPARRPPPYRSGGAVPGVAKVVGRPPFRRARGVRRHRAGVPHPGGPR